MIKILFKCSINLIAAFVLTALTMIIKRIIKLMKARKNRERCVTLQMFANMNWRISTDKRYSTSYWPALRSCQGVRIFCWHFHVGISHCTEHRHANLPKFAGQKWQTTIFVARLSFECAIWRINIHQHLAEGD